MDKKELVEADVRTRCITPALVAPGGRWDVMTQLREEIDFAAGSVHTRGQARPDVAALKRESHAHSKKLQPLDVIEQQMLDDSDIMLKPFRSIAVDWGRKMDAA